MERTKRPTVKHIKLISSVMFTIVVSFQGLVTPPYLSPRNIRVYSTTYIVELLEIVAKLFIEGMVARVPAGDK